MLIYHPAFDLNHCSFRMIQLLYHMKVEDVEIERLRIWDFYFVFPNEVKNSFNFTKETMKLRKLFKTQDNPFEDLSSPKRIFSRMNSYQHLAIKSLISHGLVVQKDIKKPVVQLVKEVIPQELEKQLLELSIGDENLIKLITSPFNDLPLFGDSGFKKRTGLLEFKYDKS